MSRTARRILFVVTMMLAAFGVGTLFAGVTFGAVAFVGAFACAFALIGIQPATSSGSLWSTPRQG